MFHVQKVAGGFDGAEAAVLQVSGELCGVAGGGVFVPGAVDEQDWGFDLLACRQVVVRVKLQNLAEVVVHLVILMTVEGADVAVVEALEQRRQVFADGVVDQVAHVITTVCGQVVEALVQVVAHGAVDDGRERADHCAFDPFWPMRQGDQCRRATPGERQHVLGVEMIDQLQQELAFFFTGQWCAVQVMGFGPARVGLVIKHHVECGVKVTHGLRKRCGGGQ